MFKKIPTKHADRVAAIEAQREAIAQANTEAKWAYDRKLDEIEKGPGKALATFERDVLDWERAHGATIAKETLKQLRGAVALLETNQSEGAKALTTAWRGYLDRVETELGVEPNMLLLAQGFVPPEHESAFGSEMLQRNLDGPSFGNLLLAINAGSHLSVQKWSQELAVQLDSLSGSYSDEPDEGRSASLAACATHKGAADILRGLLNEWTLAGVVEALARRAAKKQAAA